MNKVIGYSMGTFEGIKRENDYQKPEEIKK